MFGLSANSLRYSTEAPPTSIPDVARIMHGPPSIIFFRSWGEPTWLKISDVNGFLLAKMLERRACDRKSG